MKSSSNRGGFHLAAVHFQRGVTLNEWIAILLLAVVAFGVAVPYFMNASRAAARQASAGNLQQWGIALNLFLTEYDNRLPETGGADIRTEDKLAWYNSLPPYLSQTPLAELPSFPQPGEPSLWMDPALSKKEKAGVRFSYGMNARLQPDRGVAPFKIFEIDDPTRVVFLTEVAGLSPRVQAADVRFRHGKKDPDPGAKAHVLFCDGHVELVSRAELKDNPAAEDSKAPMSKVSWVPFGGAPDPEK